MTVGPGQAVALAALSDEDWSTGPWESECATRLVRQRASFDCGVACLAMAAGVVYEEAARTFTQLGLDKGVRRSRPYSSNFTQLRRALLASGVTSTMRRWQGWEALRGIGVVKVKPRSRLRHPDWHWVVVESHEQFGHVIRDPASPLASFGAAPQDTAYCEYTRMVPAGNWIHVHRPPASGASRQHPVPAIDATQAVGCSRSRVMQGAS